MMSSKYRKGVIFITFIMSIVCGSLLCTSLVTNHWIESTPFRKPNPEQSSGRLYFGLLHGKKELNVAFGWRPQDITVSDMIDKNPNLMSRSLWLTTLVSTCLALSFTAFAAFLAIINTVMKPRISISSTPGMYMTNVVSFVMCLLSICSWSIQFHTKLIENVLTEEDLANFWTSEGVTKIGFSFWLLVGAIITYPVNILLIRWSTHTRQTNRGQRSDFVEEKQFGAIMLY